MARQKISKMRKHEMDETPAFEKKEERFAKEHFSHGGEIPEHRQKHYKMGTHAVDHRESNMGY